MSWPPTILSSSSTVISFFKALERVWMISANFLGIARRCIDSRARYRGRSPSPLGIFLEIGFRRADGRWIKDRGP